MSRATSLGGCFGESLSGFSAGSPVPPSPGGHLVYFGQLSITPPVVNTIQGWVLHSLLHLEIATFFVSSFRFE